jgi:hypothetical protein
VVLRLRARAVPRGPGRRTLAGVAAAAGLFEVTYITLQAARGEASHYNVGDPFHAAMYGLMGVAAVALTGCALALGLALARTGGEGAAVPLPRPYLHSVALGLVLTFVLGAGAGAVLSTGDGHWIGGARTDAGGVPLFGWSRTGGDLRVAHFLGMHAMHVLPALGALLARLLPLRRHGLAVAGVRLGAALYAGLTAAAFLQALRGEPLVPL